MIMSVITLRPPTQYALLSLLSYCLCEVSFSSINDIMTRGEIENIFTFNYIIIAVTYRHIVTIEEIVLPGAHTVYSDLPLLNDVSTLPSIAQIQISLLACR